MGADIVTTKMEATERIELSPKAYETFVLPLNYVARVCRSGGIRTHDPSLKRRVP